jgi:putative ABC transport system permease protein
MSGSNLSELGGLARRALLAILPRDDWSQAFLTELDAELERLLARGEVRRPRWWYAKQLLSPQTLFFLAMMRTRARRSGPRRMGVASLGPGRGSGMSWLDVKLGFRMLVKYPVLTVVGGLAIAFAIFVGASFFEFVTQLLRPSLPLEDGDRIVAVRLWDAASSRDDSRALHDFARWRGQLRSIEELSAFRVIQRNLAIEGRGVEPIGVAEMSASAFTLTRVTPLVGRYLDASDEWAGAPAVVVIGYDLWQERLGGDPNAVGRTVRLGDKAAVIVGIMPEGFAFPVSNNLWVPLELNPASYAPRDGPGIRVFGRLADGYGIDEAQGELTTLGQQAAADSPDTHAQLRPQVQRYAEAIMGVPIELKLGLVGSNLLVILLLALVCGNVALLMFARAATRENELVVRNALGAGRGRIVAQLFTEALVLGGVGAALGLAGAGYGLRLVLGFAEREAGGGVVGLPFWFRDTLSPSTIAYAGALTVLGAVIAGVVPALKVTGKGVEARLRQSVTGGNHAGFGGIWTFVIVSQVALTVAFPATAYTIRRGLSWERSYDFGFPAHEYLAVELRFLAEPRPGVPPMTRSELLDRFAAVTIDFQARLALEPEVVQTAFTDRVPGSYHDWFQIEMDPGAVTPRDERGRVGSAQVDPGYFAALGASVVLGRGFTSDDIDSEHRVVVVNEAFVDDVLGGANPIGRRLRYVASDEDGMEGSNPGPWHEIVGVVPHLGMHNRNGSRGVYHPIRPGGLHPLYMIVGVAGGIGAAGSRLREVAAAVDPALQLHDLMGVDQARSYDVALFELWYRVVLMVSGVALFLALAGIYAVMAFTVSRRTREIGIRVALGSDRMRIALSIFRRPLAQVSLGILVGMAWASYLAAVPFHGPTQRAQGFFTPTGAAMVAGYALLMIGVCLLACIVPARRALAVEPTVALKAEG